MDQTTKKRKLEGVVVSDKMNKTVVVAVTRLGFQSKYKKYYRIIKKYKAHNEKGEYHTGDQVIIEETRPLSKEKRWIIVRKVESRK
jgi:small subunit ribosomal protein S17